MRGLWITDGTGKPFYTRKIVTIDKKIKKATASVCGLGQFVFHINGKKVGDHELDPGWTSYNKRIQYVVFDVTDQLCQGKNAIGAEIGNGWFIMEYEHYSFHFPPFMPPNPNPYQPFGESLVFAMELKLLYEDGTEESICTDDSFKVREHAISMSNVYGSETCDGSRYPGGWDTVAYNDSLWKQAQIVLEKEAPKGIPEEQSQPPVKVIHRYKAKFLHNNIANRRIYDLGQNISGILDFEVKGKKGTELRFYPAEKLDENGDVDQMAKNWMLIDNCITYRIGKDNVWEHFRMKFTYFAGRYFAVEGLEDTGAELRNFYGDAVTSAWMTDGKFHCDDERYNKIYDMIEKTVEANMLSVHTDCPTIERFAWQEPNHLMAPSIMFMKRSDRLWNKFLTDMRTDQLTDEDSFSDGQGGRYYPGEGLMPSQCPCYIPNVLPVPGLGDFYDIIPWGSTCILGTYWHYMFYNDKKIIEDNYDAGMRYLEHVKSKQTEEGFLNYGLGDWGNPENNLARENVETAFLYADAMILGSFAEILGKTEDEKKLKIFAEAVKKNYNDRLLIKHPEKDYWCYCVWDHKDEVLMTQAAEALPLYWGMVPEEKVPDVVKAFRDTLEKKGALVSGEIGLPYVIQTASRYGMNDLICKYITKEEHPSYYAFVLDDETTLGEYWEKNPRSHCHDMMGHIIEWFYNGLAGIKPIKPGFRKIKIQPYLPESMNSFTCSYHSVAGMITIKAERVDGKPVFQVTVPEGVEYELSVEARKENPLPETTEKKRGRKKKSLSL